MVGAAGGDVLVAALVKEALAVTLRPIPRGATAAEKALTKAYVAALAKLAAAVPLGRTDTIQDEEERASAEASLSRGAVAAALAGGRVTEKTTAGLFASAAEKMRTAAGLSDGSELAEEAEEGVAAMVLEECRAMADSDHELPAAAAGAPKKSKKSTTTTKKTKHVARRRGAEREDDSEDDDEEEEEQRGPSDEEEDDDDENDDESPASVPPPPPPQSQPRREATKRASKTAAKAKLVEEAEEEADDEDDAQPTVTAKTTRSTRATRAALKENVAH